MAWDYGRGTMMVALLFVALTAMTIITTQL